MAINPESQYPGKITPASVDYPYGEAQNITVPSDGTGTPWEAALVNDLFGFQQALLSEAAVVPSGTPDKVGASQYLESLFKSSGLVKDDYTALRLVESDQLSDKTNCFITDSDAGGAFALDKTDTTSLDDGGITIVDADGGRWKRIFSGSIYLTWFGVNGISDSSTEVNAVLANSDFTSAYKITFPKETAMSSPLYLKSNTVLRGVNGRYGDAIGSQITFTGCEAFEIDDTNKGALGTDIRGIAFKGADTHAFFDRTGVTSGFGDWKFGWFIKNEARKWTSIDFIITGHVVEQCNFDENPEVLFQGGDNWVEKNFINSKLTSSPGNWCCTISMNNSLFYKNYVTAGSHASQADNPDGVLITAATGTRILDNWMDLPSVAAIKLTGPSEGIIVRGNKTNCNNLTDTISIVAENKIDLLIEGNLFTNARYGVIVSGASAHDVTIQDNLYNDITEERVFADLNALYAINVDEPHLPKNIAHSALSPSNRVQSFTRGLIITNEGASGAQNFYLPEVAKKIGDTYEFYRIAAQNMSINYVATPQFIILSTGPQRMSFTWNGTSWDRNFIDDILPQASTYLNTGELWDNVGTVTIA